MTLALLWHEYRASGPDGYGYSRFCDLYGEWRHGIMATMRAPRGFHIDTEGRLNRCQSYRPNSIDPSNGSPTSERASDLPTRHGVCLVHLGRARLNSGPLLGGMASHEAHIGALLARQAAPAGEPDAHPPGAGIVGGREAEISELAPQVAQRASRIGRSLRRVEGAGKTAPARGRSPP